MKDNKGITLITLIITVIIMLILVGVTVDVAVDGKLVDSAKGAVDKTNDKVEQHQDRIDELITELDNITVDNNEEVVDIRQISVEKSISEGQDLWSSTVTFNLDIENYDVTDITFDQMKELAAYLLDFEDYDDLQEFMVSTFSGGEEYTYEEIIELLEFESEQAFLYAVIDGAAPYVSFRDINKLENMGINVISVETPYGTTLHTIPGGTLQCAFVENGTYDFKIKSGSTTITETVTINNVRDYSKQSPYDINIEYTTNDVGDEVAYAVDNSEEWSTLSDSVLSCNNGISLKIDTGVCWASYVIKDKNYYKYFINDNLWHQYIEDDEWYLFKHAAKNLGMSSRQTVFLLVMAGQAKVNDVCPQGAGRFYDYLNDLFKTSYLDDGVIPESIISLYPEVEIGVRRFLEVDEVETLTFTSDTYISVQYHQMG